MTRWLRLAACCAAVAACSGSPLAPLDHEILSDAALGRTIERDLTAPVQTDSLVHHFTGQSPWYRVTVPFRYRNDTGREITIPNCHGGLYVGEIFSRDFRIGGALPGHNGRPAFASANLDGEYRLVWHGLVLAGEAMEPLRSNPFLLVAPAD